MITVEVPLANHKTQWSRNPPNVNYLFKEIRWIDKQHICILLQLYVIFTINRKIINYLFRDIRWIDKQYIYILLQVHVIFKTNRKIINYLCKEIRWIDIQHIYIYIIPQVYVIFTISRMLIILKKNQHEEMHFYSINSEI